MPNRTPHIRKTQDHTMQWSRLNLQGYLLYSGCFAKVRMGQRKAAETTERKQQADISPEHFHVLLLVKQLYTRHHLFLVHSETFLEHGDASAFWRHHVKNSFQGCTFSCPVFTNQPHNAVRGKREADIFQSESGIVFINILNA